MFQPRTFREPRATRFSAMPSHTTRGPGPPALGSRLEPLGSDRFERLMQCITVELSRPNRSTASTAYNRRRVDR